MNQPLVTWWPYPDEALRLLRTDHGTKVALICGNGGLSLHFDSEDAFRTWAQRLLDEPLEAR